MRGFTIALLLLAASLHSVKAQVYSPKVLKKGQPDATDLRSLAQGIFSQASARTTREKAEAIWRFFLTDGRFAKPGLIYHIAGWAYEEPQGEVLDPIRLLNSYGFGLCYHIAPLLESVFKAGGFSDARVWFLTGHTVAEVFYDDGYHYFDSDMMGYSPIGTVGPLKERPVASVHQIERDGGILTGKLAGTRQSDVSNVDSPWYPADLRAHAIGDLAKLFTTSDDNWLYPFQRYEMGHTMDFVLRPGERLVRYFHPEPEGLYYLPYRFDGTSWVEFPQEVEQYKIRTSDGPQSQKDGRRWATGMLEYQPPAMAADSAVYSMPSPYVIIDANFQMQASLKDADSRITVETSVDAGHEWTAASTLTGPHEGSWTAAAAVLTQSEHGARNAVSGTYGYLVRITRTGGARINDLTLTTRFQLNPRTLPELAAGNNEIEFTSSSIRRWELREAPLVMQNAARVVSGGQGYVANLNAEPGNLIFALEAPDGGEINGFDVGGRFLDLSDGLAPDKFTAELRKVTPWPTGPDPQQAASIAWSESVDGPYRALWTFDPKLKWRDGDPIDRTLRWPEVDRELRDLPKGTRRVYVRYQMQGLAVDALRIATIRSGLISVSPLRVTHLWRENGTQRQQVEAIGPKQTHVRYQIKTPPDTTVLNDALILESPRPK